MARIDITSFRGEQFSLSGTVLRGEASLSADVVLPAAVLPVDSTSGYAAAGSIVVAGQLLAYTGITPASFTGVTGGSGTLPQGAFVQAAVDLRSNVALVFSARRARGGAAVVSKTIGSGITVPAGAPGHAYTIAIGDEDTNAFTEAEELAWELRMTESVSGDITVVTYGGWKIGLGAS
jgi:hypothetical protein